MSIQKYFGLFKKNNYIWFENPILNLVLLIGLILIVTRSLSVLISSSIDSNDGHLVYALDDPYIHMAIGKNLISNGVWGTSAHSFSSSSSSLLWPILNAFLFLLIGYIDGIPLILNIISALFCVYFLFRITLKSGLPFFISVLIILPVIYLAPLPGLILTGMEHTAHLALSLAVIYYAVLIFIEEPSNNKNHIILLVLIFLLSAVRYEGIFLGLVVAGCLILKKLYKLGLVTIFLAVTPMLIFGFISIKNGWFFLPNPILLKADIPIGGLSLQFINRSIEHGLWRLDQHKEFRWLLGFSFLFLVLFLIFKDNKYKKLAWMHLLFLGMLLPHLLWSGFGWFYRYEMYLVGTGIFLALLTFGQYVWYPRIRSLWNYTWRCVIVFSLTAYSFHIFSYRLDANRNVVRATTNIYQQQYQMARFLDRYYSHQSVAINDIGAISLYSNVNVIDLWGLANLDVSRNIINQTYDTSVIQGITQESNVQIAMVYDSWFTNEKKIPKSWIRVGQWIIQNNIVCGDDTVAIYAVDPAAVNQLIHNLRDFSIDLPIEVVQRGSYTSIMP